MSTALRHPALRAALAVLSVWAGSAVAAQKPKSKPKPRPAAPAPAKAAGGLPVFSQYRSPRNAQRPLRKSTLFIVLHTTEGAAKGSLEKLSANGECHYVVDTGGAIYSIVDKGRVEGCHFLTHPASTRARSGSRSSAATTRTSRPRSTRR